MSSEKDSYKQIFKTTSIFGGIQVFNILISIAKSKIIAVLLGPAGLGIISIFNSTATLIASCTNLGQLLKSVIGAFQFFGKPVVSVSKNKYIFSLKGYRI